jgi:cell division protease FtsH
VDSSKWLRNSFVYLIVLVAVIALFVSIFPPAEREPSAISIDQVVTGVMEGRVRQITVQEDRLTVEFVDRPKAVSYKEKNSNIYQILYNAGVTQQQLRMVTIDVKEAAQFGNWLGLFANFLPLIFFGAILLFMMRQAQGSNNQAMSFGKSRARMIVANKPTVTFDDVAGVEEAKIELQEVVEFLKYPEKFVSLGAKIPKGVLLVGPPGTGKTLLSRAVAGEAGVPFFSISGSEFVEMFVGVGASRVRDLFDQAKRNAPCIVFVDEIDAVGRQRGAGLGGSHDEREQTLNQILVEMDGFDTNTNVIVIAATNRQDVLDPALLRPGRFDRQVVLDRPDIAGRRAILEVHAKGKPLAEEVSLEVLAKQTPGFSGADLANLVNEAAILAARRDKKTVGLKEFEEAVDRVIAGPERKSRIISEKEKAVTAYHEAGHALVARYLENTDPVHKISIIARGMMGGYTRVLPREDRYLWSKSQFEDTLAWAMGGNAAERLVYNEVTTGASNDIERATAIARKMVTEYGMSERLGPVSFTRSGLNYLGQYGQQRKCSNQITFQIDQEIRTLMTQARSTAEGVLRERLPQLKAVATALIEHETLEGHNLVALLEGRLAVWPTKTPSTAEDSTQDPADEAEPEMPEPKVQDRRTLPGAAIHFVPDQKGQTTA